MSRLPRSNFADKKNPCRPMIGRRSSYTTADFPMPDGPETSTSSGCPVATTRSKASRRAAHSASRP